MCVCVVWHIYMTMSSLSAAKRAQFYLHTELFPFLISLNGSLPLSLFLRFSTIFHGGNKLETHFITPSTGCSASTTQILSLTHSLSPFFVFHLLTPHLCFEMIVMMVSVVVFGMTHTHTHTSIKDRPCMGERERD